MRTASRRRPASNSPSASSLVKRSRRASASNGIGSTKFTYRATRSSEPYGFALEHFDPIGRYRAQENGLDIDATGTLEGKKYNEAAQLAALMREDPNIPDCMMHNFYRHANGRANDDVDVDLVEKLAAESCDS